MKEKLLILTRGIPGSGKTTFAHFMADSNEYPVISADDYFMVDNEYKYDRNLIGQAHAHCQSKTEKHMRAETERIFVANTFTTEREMQPYFDLAKKYGYKVFSIVIENRHGNINVHDVPKETIQKMKDRFDIKL